MLIVFRFVAHKTSQGIDRSSSHFGRDIFQLLEYLKRSIWQCDRMNYQYSQNIFFYFERVKFVNSSIA